MLNKLAGPGTRQWYCGRRRLPDAEGSPIGIARHFGMFAEAVPHSCHVRLPIRPIYSLCAMSCRKYGPVLGDAQRSESIMRGPDSPPRNHDVHPDIRLYNNQIYQRLKRQPSSWYTLFPVKCHFCTAAVGIIKRPASGCTF